MLDNDHSLMKRTAQGDLSAFEELVAKYQRLVLNTIFRYIGNQAEAEDLSQEVFIRVFKFAKRYRPKAKFTTWLYRIITNICLNYYRQKKRKPSISLDSPVFVEGEELPLQISLPPDTHPDVILERQERDSIIREAIDSLPENQKMAVILQRFEGLSYGEISKIMGCSVSAIESLLFRAKQTLKEKLRNYLKEGRI